MDIRNANCSGSGLLCRLAWHLGRKRSTRSSCHIPIAAAVRGRTRYLLIALLELWLRPRYPAVASRPRPSACLAHSGLLLVANLSPALLVERTIRIILPGRGSYSRAAISAADRSRQIIRSMFGWLSPIRPRRNRRPTMRKDPRHQRSDRRPHRRYRRGRLPRRELIVPQFVLHELQMVADSSDSAKRNRGRRGLDVVQRLQKTPGISSSNVRARLSLDSRGRSETD